MKYPLIDFDSLWGGIFETIKEVFLQEDYNPEWLSYFQNFIILGHLGKLPKLNNCFKFNNSQFFHCWKQRCYSFSEGSCLINKC